MGTLGGPMLLVEPTTMPTVVHTYITTTPTITSMNVYGGPAAIANTVATTGNLP